MLQEQEAALFRHSFQAGRSFGSNATESGSSPSDAQVAFQMQREEDMAHWQMLTGSRHLGTEDYVFDASPDTNDMSYETLQNLGEVVGTANKGLQEVEISALPVHRYDSAKGQEGDAQCVICQCEFDDKDLVKHLPCKHMYHAGCIQQWLKINKVCPVCSTEVCTREPDGESLHQCKS